MGKTGRRSRIITALAIASSALLGCSDGGGTAGSRSAPNPREPIQALLRARSAALNAGDVEGYLAR